MKLFKRTSIFLSILIIVLWTFIFIWAYYPINNVRVSDVEKEQTVLLLRKSNISVSDEIISKKVKAVKTPDVIFTAKSSKKIQRAIKEGKLKKNPNGTYSFEDSVLTVNGNNIKIEGKSPIIEKITTENAIAKSKKLITHLGLSKKNMSTYMYERQDGILVTYIPEYKGKRVFDCKINVMMYGEMRYKIETLPVNFKYTGRKTLPKSVCQALADFSLSGDVDGAVVSSMNLGYKTDGTSLKPVWEIKTSNNNVYYIE